MNRRWFLKIVASAGALAVLPVKWAESAVEAVQTRVASRGGKRRSAFYVSPTGSPDGRGTSRYPCDLQTAMRGGPTGSEIGPGTTIYFKPGTYVALNPNSNAKVDFSGVTFMPAEDKDVVFDMRSKAWMGEGPKKGA